jgi:hypothetical protein
VVNLGLVRLQDELGNLIMGSPAMPLIGYDDHLYYSRYQDDVMNGGRVYEAYSAYAWNRIAGKRPVCGNYNAPCNIGEYLRDLPQHNILEIHGQNGQPLKGAMLQLHQPHFYPSVYGKLFPREPDAVYFTDALGQVDLGASPFGDLSTEVGPQKGVILLKITSAGQSSYQFFEITRANEVFWMGDHDRATYDIETGLQQGPQPTHVFLPLVVKDYESNPPNTFTVTSQPGDGEVGNIYCAAWDACRNALEGNLPSSIYEAATVAARFEAGTYDVKRVFFTFDTSALPEGATVVSAQLHFYAGPFQNGSNLRLHVVDSSQADPLTNDDFSQVGFISGGFADLTPDTWMQIPLKPAAWSWIVKGGLTKLALMHDLDLNNITPTLANDSVIAMSEDAAHQPYLVVRYR